MEVIACGSCWLKEGNLCLNCFDNKGYICNMEKIKEKMPQLVKNATVREEILQGMITSFQLEGIKISQETAYTILERVDLKLKMCKR